MKRIGAYLILIFLISCNTKEEQYVEPLEISFTEYSLSRTACWQTSSETNQVVIINSAEEMAKYIACTDGNYPAIDFSKHTLLLAGGSTTNGVSAISKRLQQLSSKQYTLDVEITLDDTTIIQDWAIAIVTKKMSGRDKIELNTVIINN